MFRMYQNRKPELISVPNIGLNIDIIRSEGTNSFETLFKMHQNG